MNIFEEIRSDHDKMRTLIKILANTSGNSEGRNEIYPKLKTMLERHADAEERYFYKPLFDHDISQDMARHSVAEHHEIDEYLEELEKTDMSSPSWIATAKKLEERLVHHLDEEEQEVFQLAGKALSDSKKSSLATEYRKMMDAE